MVVTYRNGNIDIEVSAEERICECDILVALEKFNILPVEETYATCGWDTTTLLYDRKNDRCFELRCSDINYLNENHAGITILPGRAPTEEDRSRLVDLFNKLESEVTAAAEFDYEEVYSAEEIEEEETMENFGTCEQCGCVLESEYDVNNFDGYVLCEDCLDEQTRICDCCGRRIWNDDDAGDFNTILCEHCRDNYYSCCDDCGRLIHDDDACYVDGEDYPYCPDCYERHSRDYIHSYSYKPNPVFHGRGTMFFGVELELDKGGEDDDKAEEILSCTDSDHLYVKHDGSLDDGMELVSHPMTLEYHKNSMPWKDIVETAVDLGYRSHQTGTCGLHVHVNRKAFGCNRSEQDEVISRILYIVERFWQEMLKFSRRTEYQIDRWAARYGIKDNPKQVMDNAKKGDRGRYACINLCNYNTIEFRIFRGTLKYNTLIATLQMVEHICQTAMEMTDEEITALSWPEFIEKIHYDELIQYLKERRLYINEALEENEEEM